MANVLASRSLGLLGLVLLLIAGGCRTYGDDYGNEVKTLEQIYVANELFAADLARARTDLATLRRAAEANPLLELLAERYAALLVAHEVLLDVHRDMAVKLEADGSVWEETIGEWLGRGDYRPLSRAYGAIISEQQIMRDRYQGVIENVFAVGGDSLAYVWALEPYPEARYYVVPPQYERIRNLGAYTSMERALGGGQGGRGSAPDGGGRAREDAAVEEDNGAAREAAGAQEQ